MKPFLLWWIVGWAASPAFPQAISSGVYAWEHAPPANQPVEEARTLLEGTTRDFSHLILQAITVRVNQPTPPSQQLDEEALLIIRAGEVTLTLAGKRKILGPGSVVLIMPGDYYRAENKAAQPLSYYLMRYTSNQMPDLDLYRLVGGSFWVDWQAVSATADQPGGSRRVVACASVMSSRVEMQLTTLTAGLGSEPVHSHRAAEILISLDHPVEAHIEESLKGASVGDVIFVESGVSHILHNRDKESVTYLSIRL